MIKTIPPTRQKRYLMIGARMTRCIKTLITAFTSQISGGKAMTPGLSGERTRLACWFRRLADTNFGSSSIITRFTIH
jgi:hypothetical protein